MYNSVYHNNFTINFGILHERRLHVSIGNTYAIDPYYVKNLIFHYQIENN